MGRFELYNQAYKQIGGWELCKRMYTQISEDGILTWAAAMAYSWMFSLFPLVLFLLTLVAFLPINHERAAHDVQRFFESSLPAEASKILVEQAPTIIRKQQGALLTFGALLTLWTASGGVVATMSAINRCYDIRQDQPFYVARPKAIGMTLVGILLVLLVLILLPVVGLVKAHFTGQGDVVLSAPMEWTLDLVRWSVAVFLMFSICSGIYYFGPRLTKGFRFITPGSIFTVVSWIVLALGFKLYFSHFGAGYGKTYGTVGGAMILLLFTYLVSLVLLVGAELNSEFDYAMFGKTGGTTHAKTEPTRAATAHGPGQGPAPADKSDPEGRPTSRPAFPESTSTPTPDRPAHRGPS